MADTLFKTSLIERTYLERLTNYELIHLADTLGIEIPPDLERLFIIAEILDIAAEQAEGGGTRNKEEVLAETAIPDPVPLPKQYNITFIDVLIRDPLWVFTFWEVKSADKELHENALDFGGYHLKVIPLGLSGGASKKKEAYFTIPVGNGDIAWYIGFPPEGGCFTVELCALRGNDELALAVSRPFTLPILYNPPGRRQSENTGDRYANPLLRLSGAENLYVIRNGDRQSRGK
jgi:hypothetical protein